jgi:hypothetical protein
LHGKSPAGLPVRFDVTTLFSHCRVLPHAALILIVYHTSAKITSRLPTRARFSLKEFNKPPVLWYRQPLPHRPISKLNFCCIMALWLSKLW